MRTAQQPNNFAGGRCHALVGAGTRLWPPDFGCLTSPAFGDAYDIEVGRTIWDRSFTRGLEPPGSGGLAPLRLQMRVEKGEDAPPCISRGSLVVARSWRKDPEDRLQDGERKWILVSSSFMVIEKGVPSLRVLLDIVFDPDGRQCPLKAIGGPSQCAIPAAVASDNRASSSQEAGRVGVLRSGAVVDARHRESTIGGEQQGEPASHAVADYADPARAALPGRQPDRAPLRCRRTTFPARRVRCA